MFEQFAAGARTVVSSALEEAQRRGDRRIGTEHLFLGLLHHTGAAATLGVGLDAARTALDDLDKSALAVIGLDVGGVERPPVPRSHKRTPLTSGARSVLPRALTEVRRTGGRRITEEHLLLALLDCELPDEAAALMLHLDIDRPAARERVRRSLG